MDFIISETSYLLVQIGCHSTFGSMVYLHAENEKRIVDYNTLSNIS